MKGRKITHRRRKRRNQVLSAIVAVVLVAALGAGLFLNMGNQAQAAEKTSDANTSGTYENVLGQANSTRYDGRIWADKTVYTSNATFSGIDETVGIGNEDFLISYSALATSTQITGEASVPVDVVFVIDDSASMTNNNNTALAQTVAAVNQSINTLMSQNTNNRVAVVLYASSSQTLLPLGHYSATGNDGQYIAYTGSGRYFKNTVKETVGYNNPTRNPNNQNDNGWLDMSDSRGTNIQMGVYTGMDLLESNDDTTISIEGTTVKRVPAIVLLSDGSPTYSSSSENWWNPSNNNRQGPGGSPYYGNGMLAMATASYMKQAINQNYDVAGTPYAAKVYTVGMGISSLSNYSWGSYTGEQDLAYMTLNPAGRWSGNNTMANNIRDAWDTYVSEESVDIQVEQGGFWDDGTYTMTHPSSDDITTLQYNDGYFDANDASDIAGVFEDIVSEISASVPKVPTRVNGTDPTEDGYITYTDPIGKYMEVTDVKTIIYANQRFDRTGNPTTSGNTTTYTFTGTVNSPVYGENSVSDILITVTTADDGSQTLEIKIPASVIPIRVTTVALNEDGSVESNTDNGVMPIRILYTVSLQDDVDLDTLEGVSEEYIEANATDDGKVNFYSNLYSGNTEDGWNDSTKDEVTVGDAKVEFTPAATNPFYYMQENTPLYLDEDCTNPATGFDPDETYHFEIQYYRGNTLTTTVVERPGEEIQAGNTTVDGGQLYIKAGAPRLGYLDDFIAMKGANANASGTAASANYPVYKGEGAFGIWLGNNGLLQLDAPESLTIQKEVTADEGLTAPDEDFTFEVTIADKANSTVTAVKTAANGTTTSEVELTFDGDGKAQFTLKADEKLEIPYLGAGTDYTIEEINIPAGFSSDAADDTATGTISDTDENIVTFINNYSVTPITSDDLKLTLGGTKTIDGRDFQNGDSFTFTIAAGQATPDAPLPQKDGQAVTEAIITPDSGTSQEFAFDGTITFTQPGEYRYVIRETIPNTDTALPGVDYDSDIYRLTVIIADNGDGTLRLATPEEIAAQYGESPANGTANPYLEKWDGTSFAEAQTVTFENTYDAQEATIAISGTKTLNVTNSDRRLADGEFEFEIEALGSNTDGGDNYTPDADQPMPTPDKVTNIANGNGVFANMTFDQSMIGKTYFYKVTEVLPQGVSAGNNTLNGMTYDTSEKIIKVTVTRSNDGGEEHVVATVSPSDNNNNFNFVNSYEPEEVVIGDGTNAGITVQKTFSGRAWTDADSFEYTLEAVGNAPMPDGPTVSVSKPNSGTVNTAAFGEITYERAGTYTYRIKETKGDLGGVTYDEHTATVTVTVTEDQDTGTLSAEVAYDNSNALTEADKGVADASAFTNTYRSTFDTDTTINLNGTKTLNVGGNSGMILGEGNFFFTIQALDGAPLGETQTPSGNAAGTGDNGTYTGDIQLLRNITYTMADMDGTTQKDFVYLIREQIPDPKRAGMTYDESVYRVTVTVTDDGQGTLSAAEPVIEKGTLTDGTFSGEAADAVAFVNEYEPSPATVTPLRLTKVLSGDRDTDLQAGEFSFEISVVSANPEDGIALPGQTRVENAADGSVQFGDITFTKAGTYRVQVKEVIPADEDKIDGVTYDGHTITTTFTVRDVNGQLVATRTGTDGSQTFTNRYETTGTLTGADALEVTKSFTGRVGNQWLDSDAFTFILEAGDTATRDAIGAGDIVLPDNAKGLEIKADTAGHKAAFGDITFNAVGTYQFKISEVIPEDGEKAPGVSYTDKVATVTVTTTDNGDGTLTVQTAGNSEAALTFTNTYDTGQIDLEGAANLNVTKALEGRDWQDSDSFTFTLTADPDDTATVDAVNAQKIKLPDNAGGITVTNETVDATAAFGNITFTEAGTYKFVIMETEGNLPGVAYDDAVKHVTVEVTDNTDGTLSAEVVADESDELTFTNTYTPDEVTISGNESVQIQKTLAGRDEDKWLDSDAFTFQITNTNKPESVENAPMPDPATLTIGKPADGNVNTGGFGDLTFDTAGTYVYEIKEVIPAENDRIAGVTYDDHVATVTVKVTDNTQTGKLEAAVSYDNTAAKTEKDRAETDAAAFTNTYEAEPVTIGDDVNAGIDVRKTFTGRDWNQEGDSFTFQISGANNAPVPDPATLTIGKPDSGNTNTGTFGEITFDEVGTYTYTITETPGTIGGVTYDTHSATVTVEVTDNDEGQLEAEITYDNQDALTAEDRAAADVSAFTNTYQPDGDVTVADTQITLQKVLEGKTWNGDSFEFTIENTQTPDGVDTAPMPDETTVTVDQATDPQANLADFHFGPITFDTMGTYVYEVKETAGSNPGMTYSQNVATITIEVTDNLNGGYAAAVTIANETFTNTYSTELDYVAKGGLDLIKNLTGHDIAAGQFAFTVTAADEASKDKAGFYDMSKTIETTAAAMKDGTSKATMSVFDAMKFTAADAGKTYEYTIEETTGGGAGYTNDDTTYTVAITPADDGNGVLTVTTVVTGSDGSTETYRYTNAADGADKAIVTFNNSYDAKGSVSINATKTLEHGNLINGQFTFYVKDNKGTNVATGTNNAGGKVTFPELEYTIEKLEQDLADGIALRSQNGANYVYTYQYTVEEDTTSLGGKGITPIMSAFKISVEVADQGDGTLSVKVNYPADSNDTLAFKNAYGASANQPVNFIGEKVIETESGDNAPTLADIAGKYTFTITGEDGAPMPEKTSAQNDASGTVSFGFAHFKMEDLDGAELNADGQRERTFTYTVTEKGTVDGITNDQETKTITVTITDQGDGTLRASVNPSGITFTFTNTYSVEQVESTPTDGSLTINKDLTGRDLKEGEFKFQMKDANGKTVSEGSNAADGSVAFSKIKFEEPGTYEYTISEVKGDLGGVSYDGSAYKAVAEVSDEGDGTMSVTWTITDGNGQDVDKITFENVYDPAATSVTLGAAKRLDGRAVKEGEFTFELKDEDGKVLSKAVNDANGTVLFDTLTYDEAGTYHYTVSEAAGKDAAITYDDTVYDVTVTVTDTGTGTLEASVETGEDGLVFTNIYTEPEKAEKPQEPNEPDILTGIKTGDPATVVPLLLLMEAALVAMFTVAVRRRRR